MIYAPSGDAPALLTPVATLREAAALRVYKSAAVATTRLFQSNALPWEPARAHWLTNDK